MTRICSSSALQGQKVTMPVTVCARFQKWRRSCVIRRPSTRSVPMNTALPLSGLARQLVAAGLLDAGTAQQAQAQAQRNGQSLSSHVVQTKLASGRAVAELAAEQYGVALLALAAIHRGRQPQELSSEKPARPHRLLPLWTRGNKLFVAVSGPSTQQAINDVQFSTGLSTEAILVEDD